MDARTGAAETAAAAAAVANTAQRPIDCVVNETNELTMGWKLI